MKKIFLTLLGFTLLVAPMSTNAQANSSQLVDLVLEKKVMGTLAKGNRPIINPLNYSTQDFDQPSMSSGSIRLVKQPIQSGEPKLLKEYQIMDSPDQFQSLIRIQDLTHNKTRGYLNVGRRARRLIAAPDKHRLYVLCGGYFGSVWEIDTQRDVVIRKMPGFTPEHQASPLWNPQDMLLMPNGKTLAIGSGKLQLIDVYSGQLTADIPLPPNAVVIEAMESLSKETIGLEIRMDTGKHQYFHYHQGSSELKAGGKAGQTYQATKVQIQTPYGLSPAVSRVFFMASRNTDYIRMIDQDSLHTVGILPLDFNIDQIALSPDRQRLFAYHRRFGQVSVIELNPRTTEQFSVIKRFRDKRFLSNTPMQLAAAAGRVFLWDGEGSVIASFEQDSLYPRIGLPVETRLQDQKTWVSKPAHQRYYLREGALYAEYLDSAPSDLAQPIGLDSPVVDFVLSPDRKQLYAVTENSNLLKINPATHEIIKKITLGLNPQYLSISNDGQHLSVIDADRGSLREIRTSDLQVNREVVIDMGEQQPYQITLFNPRMPQIVEVELPRYLSDVVRVAR